MPENNQASPIQFTQKLVRDGRAIFHASAKSENQPPGWESTDEILQSLTPGELLEMGGSVETAGLVINKDTAAVLQKPNTVLPEAFSKDNTPKTIGLDTEISESADQPDILIHTKDIPIEKKIDNLHMRLSLTDETLTEAQAANQAFDDIRDLQEQNARRQKEVDAFKKQISELNSKVKEIEQESTEIITHRKKLSDVMQAKINSLSSLEDKIKTLKPEYRASKQAVSETKQEVTAVIQKVQSNPTSKELQLDKLDQDIIEQAINAGNTRAQEEPLILTEQPDEELQQKPQLTPEPAILITSPNQGKEARELLQKVLSKSAEAGNITDETILEQLANVDLFLGNPPNAKLFAQSIEWFGTQDYTSSQTIVLAGTLLRNFGLQNPVPEAFREPIQAMLTPDNVIDSSKLREFVLSRLTVEIGKAAKAQTISMPDLISSLPQDALEISGKANLIQEAKTATTFEVLHTRVRAQSPSEMLWSETELESLLPHFSPAAKSTKEMLASFDRTNFEDKVAMFEAVRPSTDSYNNPRFQHIAGILGSEITKDADDFSVSFTDILRGTEEIKLNSEAKNILLEKLSLVKTVLSTKKDPSTSISPGIERSAHAVTQLIDSLKNAEPKKCIEILQDAQHERARDVLHSALVLQSIKDRAGSLRMQLPQLEISPEMQGSEIQLIFKGALPPALALAFRSDMPELTALGSSEEPFILSLDVNKDLILVTGPNGNGKTVFTKTIAAALLGYPTISRDTTPALTIRGNANTVSHLFDNNASLFEQSRQTGYSTFQTTARNLAGNLSAQLLFMDEAIKGTNDEYSKKLNAAIMLAKGGLVSVQHGAAETLTSALQFDRDLAQRIVPIVVDRFKPRIGEVAINSGGLGLLTALAPPQELLSIIESLAKERGIKYSVEKNAASIAQFLTETGKLNIGEVGGFPAETVRSVGFTNEAGGINWLASELMRGSLTTQALEKSSKNPITFHTDEALLYQIIRKGPEITNALIADRNGLPQRTALFDLFASQMLPEQWLIANPGIEQILKQTVPDLSKQLKRWFDRKPTERFQLLAIASSFSGSAKDDTQSAVRLMTDLARLKPQELGSLVTTLEQSTTDVVTSLSSKTPLTTLMSELSALTRDLTKPKGALDQSPNAIVELGSERMRSLGVEYLFKEMKMMKSSLISMQDRAVIANTQLDPDGTSFYTREIASLEKNIDDLYASNRDISGLLFGDIMPPEEYKRLEGSIRETIASNEKVAIENVPTFAEAIRSIWVLGQKNIRHLRIDEVSNLLNDPTNQSALRGYQVLESTLASLLGNKLSESGYQQVVSKEMIHPLSKFSTRFNRLPERHHPNVKDAQQELVYRLQYLLEHTRHQNNLSVRIPQGKVEWPIVIMLPSWKIGQQIQEEIKRSHASYQARISTAKSNIEHGTRLNTLQKGLDEYFGLDNHQDDLLKVANIMQSRFKEIVELGEKTKEGNYHTARIHLKEITDLTGFLEKGTLPVEISHQTSLKSLILQTSQSSEPVARFFTQALSLVAVQSVMQKNPKLAGFDAATATQQVLETTTLLSLANLMKSLGTTQPIQAGSKIALDKAVNLATISEIVSKNRQAHPNMPIEVLFDQARNSFIPLTANLNRQVSIIVGPNGSGKSTAETTVLQQYALQKLVNRTLGDVSLQPMSRAYTIGSGKASLDESTFTNSARQIAEVTRAIQNVPANEQVLVAIDEMGTGTNPQEAEIIKKAVLKLLSDHANVSVIFIDQDKATLDYLQMQGVPLTTVGFHDEHKLEVVGGYIDPDSLKVSQSMGVPAQVIRLAESIH